MVRFLHTADWQLGMPARFLGDEAAVRFAAARLDAVRALGRVARERGCAFVLVCGDAFDSNLVGRRMVHQAARALAEAPVPVYVLPGNHDALDPSALYRRDEFLRSAPGHVHVLEAAGVVEATPGTEIVAAPWRSRRPAEDLAAAACRDLSPAPDGVVRILAAHGAVDVFGMGGTIAPSAVRLEALERRLADGVIHFAALGDRHSVTRLGSTGRVWYSGTPEATDFDEQDSGKALVVEVDAGACHVDPVRIGRWRFLRERRDVTGAEGLDALASWLAGLADPGETVVRLELTGTVDMGEHARLMGLLQEWGDVLADLQRPDDDRDLAVLPTAEDFDRLRLGGFVAAAVRELRERAEGDGEAARAAQDALKLAFRLGVTEAR